MHGVKMNDYACNGGESRKGRDNNMHKFNHHSQKWHSEHSETLPKSMNENTAFLKQNELTGSERKTQHNKLLKKLIHRQSSIVGQSW